MTTLCNRVTPLGTLIEASGTRGLLMGNRGQLKPSHYMKPQPHDGKAWIACLMKDRNGIPIPPVPVKYTKLFILDEVTAFAAGHRPCGGCQKKRYFQFVDAWCAVNRKSSDLLDVTLHNERVCSELGGHKPHVVAKLENLPSGTMVRLFENGEPHLWLLGQLFPWSVRGYTSPFVISSLSEVQVITPTSIFKVLQAGFPLPFNVETTLHPSILAYAG